MRSENIPTSQKAKYVVNVKMVGENGRTVYAKLEVYGTKYIRNDLGGHLFKDGRTMARHFNAGKVVVDINGVPRYISNGLHFFY